MFSSLPDVNASKYKQTNPVDVLVYTDAEALREFRLCSERNFSNNVVSKLSFGLIFGIGALTPLGDCSHGRLAKKVGHLSDVVFPL